MEIAGQDTPIERADATPDHGLDLGALNAKDLRKRGRSDHIPIEEGGNCTEYPCLKCFPIDGCTG